MKTKHKAVRNAVGESGHDPRKESCRQVRLHVHHLLDGKLDPPKKDELRRHLEECPGCFSRVEFSRIIREAVRRHVLKEKCPSTLLLRVRNALARMAAPVRKRSSR